MRNKKDNFLCKLGIHNWEKPSYTYAFGSNVLDWRRRCKDCGKEETYVQPYGSKKIYRPSF